MSSVVITRPFSQNLSNLSSTSPFEDYNLPQKRTAVRSHYRPFSTLYLEEAPRIALSSPSVLVKPRRKTIYRSASVGGAHALANMGLGIKKDKDKVKEPKELKEPKEKKEPQLSLRNLSDIQRTGPFSSTSSRPSTSTGMISSVERSAINDISINPANLEHLTHSTPSHPLSSYRLHRSKMDIEKPSASSNNRSKRSSKVEFDDDINNMKPDKFIESNVWLTRSGTKVHPYAKDVAPYMRAYDITCLDNDHYSDLLLQRLNPGSPSFFDYGKKPPLTVLDLGCGQGHWVLHAAYIWKTSQITGFDLMDVTLPAFETMDNINFVRGNFLYKLPFPAKSFEYIRMANLSLCIPYGQWDAVLTDVRRVLTNGGRLELIDDQIFFPYGRAPKVRESINKRETPKQSFALDADDDSDSLGDDDTLADETSTSTTSTLCSDRDSSTFPDKLSLKRDFAPISLISSSPTVTQTSSQTSALSPYPTLTSANINTRLHPAISPSPTVTQATINGAYTESRHHVSETETPSVINTTQPSHRKTQSSSSTKSNIEAPSAWSRQVQDSHDLELVFQKMLSNVYGIHTQPSEFVLHTMRQVFGKGNAGKTRSYHVNLSPYDSPIGPGGTMVISTHAAETGIKGEKESKAHPVVLDHPKKHWIGIEWEKKEKKEKKVDKKKPDKEEEGGTKSERSSLDDTTSSTSTAHPTIVSIKVANYLGLPHTTIPVARADSTDSATSDKSSGCESSSSSDRSDLDIPTVKPLPVVTAKAAARLGIPPTPPPVPPKSVTLSRSNGSDGSSGSNSARQNVKPPSSMNAKAGSRFVVSFKSIAVERTASSNNATSNGRQSVETPIPSSVHNAMESGRPDLSYPTHSVAKSESPDSSWSNSSRSSGQDSRLLYPPVLSAKAAGRLGISYSVLAAAAAAHRRSNGVIAPVQSPGLLVWPSTYISISPIELEMHACKYVQTLLGCRHALREHITGEFEGRRLVNDEEFNEAMWEYECFRRARFHWPDDNPELFDDEPFPDTLGVAPPLPLREVGREDSATKSHSRSSSSDSFNGQYRRDDLTHVRTIRVFEAVKSDDKSLVTMLVPDQAKGTPKSSKHPI